MENDRIAYNFYDLLKIMKQFHYGLLGVVALTVGFVGGVAYEKTRILNQIESARGLDQKHQLQNYRQSSPDSIRFFEPRETSISTLRLERIVEGNKWSKKR